MKKLLFICSQNRLRSPTAEAVFCKYEGLEVDSAGRCRISEAGGDFFIEARKSAATWRVRWCSTAFLPPEGAPL